MSLPGVPACAFLAAVGMIQDYAAPEAQLNEMRDETRTIEEIAKKSGLIAR